MINTILTGILASTLFITPIKTPQKPPQQASLLRVLPEGDFAGHIVQPGEYLMSIAKDYYGDKEYWTNIWNDNPWISDAAVLDSNWVIKLRTKKTEKPEQLKQELAERMADSQDVYQTDQGIVQAVAFTDPSYFATPTPKVQQVQSSQDAAPQVLSEAQITALGTCEAGMNPARNSGNGYYGAFQFSAGTWNSMNTGYARADLAPLDVQKAAVQRLVARSSIYTQFPGCSRKMQSSGLL